MELRVYARPSEELCNAMAALSPTNPFMTPAYLTARAALGAETLIATLEDGGTLSAACPVFVRSGCLTRSLEIVSLPRLSEPQTFWNGLRTWCRSHGISQLDVSSFASEQADIPSLEGEQSRRRRAEYILDLDMEDLRNRMSSNHVRNIKRGRKAGAHVIRSTEEGACRLHVALMAASMKRRRERGEQVPEQTANHLAEVRALVNRGAGELFQAMVDGQVVSSILVLGSARAGYYHSAGTSPEGMTWGASHLLVHDIAVTLRAESKWQFNLGGVDEPGSGLEQFKSGFGARRVDLEAARGCTARRLTRWLGAGASMWRHATTGVR